MNIEDNNENPVKIQGETITPRTYSCIDELVIDAKTEKIDLIVFQKQRGTVLIATELKHHFVTGVGDWNHGKTC